MSSINDILKEWEQSDLLPTLNREGGTLLDTSLRKCSVSVSNHIYIVDIAYTENQRRLGLSTVDVLDEDKGMLFYYPQGPVTEVTYVMKDTSLDLDIVFINDLGVVKQINSVKAKSDIPVVCNDVAMVLEVNINSPIKVGDKVILSDEFYELQKSLNPREESADSDEEDVEISEEEKSKVKDSKMLVLDENGDVQMKLVGGERIISRKETVQLIKKSLKAYKSDSNSDYKAVGKLLFKILEKQDNREPEYVSK